MPKGVYKRNLPPLEPRFWANVDKRDHDECWEWQASCCSGYGKIVHGGKALGAHHVSWELHNGPIPRKIGVLHTCDNRPCVNPAHLFLGTHDDNMADMRRKGRGAKGERHGMAKLSENDVEMIRSTYADGGVTQRALAKYFGVSQAAISLAIHGITWRKENLGEKTYVS